jgi:hypothetical protein
MKTEILSIDKLYKASITLRNDGLFDVEFFRWTRDVDPESQYESDYFWEPFLRPSLTDSLSNAEKLALEGLNTFNKG